MLGNSTTAADVIVRSKLDEFFWEWLSLPESQKLVRQAVNHADEDSSVAVAPASPNLTFHHGGLRASPQGRPSPPGSPHSRSGGLLKSEGSPTSPTYGESPSVLAAAGGSSRPRSPSSGSTASAPSLAQEAALQKAAARFELEAPAVAEAPADEPEVIGVGGIGASMLATGSTAIPRFWWPKRDRPTGALSAETRDKIHSLYERQGLTDGIKTHTELEAIVTEVLGLSKYFVIPIFHKIKVFYEIADDSAKTKSSLLAPSPVPITEPMLVRWCQGKIQPDDPVLTFFYVVKKAHNDWIEREDFSVFLTTILLTHPGLDFLRETSEFQDRYAVTVISRIFFVYDRQDTGKIHLSSLRRNKPSVIQTWKQLAEHDDIKQVSDYFSYEHFYVIYCTFWELDSDHDFLLDKDDLLKYDGHALSRRTVDRIFSDVVSKFTSAVPGKMGYEDFIRFLLCDQDRLTDRSTEYWFRIFDLDGDGCIRDHEMKYFYEEQVQRMECLNYDTIPFADIMCQMNDMISPKVEGQFNLVDFKKRRKVAGTFFSLLSSLNKFLAFEHRDPFAAKQDQLDNPNLSDWERWCADEYLRLAMEEGEDADEDL